LNYLSSEEWVPLERVYENCNQITAKYTYILRVYFSGYKSEFTFDGKSITIYLVNGIPDNSTRIRITSDSLKKGIVQENNRIVYKYLLFRREPFNRIKHLLINHDSVGENLFISRIEIQDINSAKANVAYVGTMIRSLSIDVLHMKQRYPSATRQLRELEPELKLSSKLSFCEFLSFLFLAINLTAFSCVFIIPCNEKSGLCKHYSQGFISSVFAGISSSISAILILLISISIYIGFIKYFYSKRRPHWNYIRICYLLLISILSIIFGVLAAYYASDNNHFPKAQDKKLKHQSYWIYATGIGSVILISIWIPFLSVIAYLLGFLTEARDFQHEDSSPTTKSTSKLTYNKSKLVKANKSKESIGDNYYEQIKTNVKSISQYPGIKPKEKPSKPPISPPIVVKSTLSEEGNQYYEDIMKNKKVKSISQYEGIK